MRQTIRAWRMKVKGHKEARSPIEIEMDKIIERWEAKEKLVEKYKEEDRTKDRLATSQMLAAPRFQSDIDV